MPVEEGETRFLCSSLYGPGAVEMDCRTPRPLEWPRKGNDFQTKPKDLCLRSPP